MTVGFTILLFASDPMRVSNAASNVKRIPNLSISAAIDGFDKERTQFELGRSGVAYIGQGGNTYGKLALTLSKIKWLVETLVESKQKHNYFCFVEDDVQMYHNFTNVTTNIVMRKFAKSPRLNLVRLSRWGEILCFSRQGAVRILEWYCKHGITQIMDNQLRLLNSTMSLPRPPISRLLVKTNKGHVMQTPSVDVDILRKVHVTGECTIPYMSRRRAIDVRKQPRVHARGRLLSRMSLLRPTLHP